MKENKTYAICVLKGAHFKPISLIKDLKWNFAFSHIRGDMDPSLHKRYDTGKAIINSPLNLLLKDKYLTLDKLLDILYREKKTLDKHHVEEIKISLVHTSKDNLSSIYLNPKIINLLNGLGIGLYIDFYKF